MNFNLFNGTHKKKVPVNTGTFLVMVNFIENLLFNHFVNLGASIS